MAGQPDSVSSVSPDRHSRRTDAYKLHDLKTELDGQQVHSWQQVEDLVALRLSYADRDKPDLILDGRVADYADKLGGTIRSSSKSKAKAFARSNGILATILGCGHATWGKLSIFLVLFVLTRPLVRRAVDP